MAFGATATGLDLGKRNCPAIRKFLWSNGMFINPEDVGGSSPCTMLMNIADGTIRALRPTGFEIFNLGGDRPVKLNYVIGLLEKYLGRKVKIKRYKLHPADVTATWANIDKSKKILGWKPTMPLEKGIENTVKWFIENRDFVRKLKWVD